MAISLMSDIFKFVALRPPQNFEYDKDLLTIIRDHRIQDMYVPGENHTIAADEPKFANSNMAKNIFELVKAKIATIPSPLTQIALSDQIADELKAGNAISEKTDADWLFEFVDIIKRHLINFDKRRLLEELDAVVTKEFQELNGLRDYVEINTYAGNADIKPASSFCEDFDNLFDHLYLLYVCKRLYPVSLEYAIDALRALHVIRFLVIEMQQEQARPPVSLQGCLYTVMTVARRLGIGRTMHQGGERRYIQETPPIDTRARTDCAISQLTNDSANIPRVPITNKEQLAALFGATPFVHQFFACLVSYYIPFNDIKPIGIGDLLVTKQFLCKYAAGEIAHVENVLKGESKERSHRRLDRTEDLFSRETENTEETERELQTTDRYELKTETEATIQDDLKGEISGSVSGKYGMVEYTASAGLSYSRSTSDSRRSTNNFAKDIVDRSLTRIQKRVREERSTKKIYEVEEINKHGLNNTSGGGHITGIYRWLNKHYKAQVYNYGKRLMFEFIVPEPAAFIQFAFEHNKEKLNKPDKPQKPAFPALDISQITDATVATFAARYDIDDLEPEPVDTMQIGASFTMGGLENQAASAHERVINIPEGYLSSIVTVAGGYDGWDKATPHPDHGIFVAIQGQVIIDREAGVIHETFEQQAFTLNPPLTGNVAIALYAYKVKAFAIAVSITCSVSSEYKRKWQIKTYRRIMDAYQKLVTEYEAALSEYEDKLEGYEVSKGVIIEGRNPLINQDIIKTELKKHCITMIAKQFDTVTNDDIMFGAMKFRTEQIDQETSVVTETKKVTVTTPEAGKTVTVTETTISETTSTSPTGNIKIPAIDVDAARAQGKVIQFLEQAFEWPQISYLLYPYFWGELPEKWLEAQAYYDEVDPLYAKFLQAGSARVLIAVRPAYEMAVMHYLCTGKPWNGGPAPGLNNPLYIPIHEELRNQQDDLNGAEPYGDAWEVVVPTSLVYLQEDAALPTYDCNPPIRKNAKQS